MKRIFWMAAILTSALLTACEAPEGGNEVFFLKEVKVTPEIAQTMVGRWEGPYTAKTSALNGASGTSVMIIESIDGTLARGRMEWSQDGEVVDSTPWTAALTKTGHFMLLSSHAILFGQGPERYIEADIMLKDGIYRHRLSAVDTSG